MGRWLLASVATVGMAAVQAADIRVRVDSFVSGSLHVQLHAADTTNWSAPLREMNGASNEIVFTDVPPGRYAVQLFVDQDGDGQLDLSPRGIPREPVGFSGNPRLFKGKPEPSGCAFEHGAVDTLAQIELRRPGSARGKAEDR